MAKACPSDFYDFLVTVDGSRKREQTFLLRTAGVFMAQDMKAEIDLVGADGTALSKQGVSEGKLSHQAGSSIMELVPACATGVHAFCCRAIAKASANLATNLARVYLLAMSRVDVLCSACLPLAQASAAPGAASAGDTVADLVAEMRKEEIKVHVDVARRVQASIASLPFSLRPTRTCLCWQGITFQNLRYMCLPSSEITDKAGGIVAKLKKEGVVKPFPYMDLAAFLPAWAQEVHQRFTLLLAPALRALVRRQMTSPKSPKRRTRTRTRKSPPRNGRWT